MSGRGFDIDDSLPPPPGMGHRASERWTGRANDRLDDTAALDNGEGRGWWRELLGGRLFYVLSSALCAGLLLLLFNPHFGRQDKAWFWDSLRGTDGVFLSEWSQNTATIVALVALTLGYLAAAFVGRSRGRGLWALAWVGVALAVLAGAGHAFLLVLGVALGAGALALPAGPGGRRFALVALAIISANLLLPLAMEDTTHSLLAEETYQSVATVVVRGFEQPDQYRQPDSETALPYIADRVLTLLPEHLSFVVLLLLLIRVLGARGGWLSALGCIVALVMVGGIVGRAYVLGTEWPGPKGEDWPSWWAGVFDVGPRLHALFLPHVLALVAALGDLRPRS